MSQIYTISSPARLYCAWFPSNQVAVDLAENRGARPADQVALDLDEMAPFGASAGRAVSANLRRLDSSAGCVSTLSQEASPTA